MASAGAFVFLTTNEVDAAGVRPHHLEVASPTQKASATTPSAAVVPRIGSPRATAKAYAGRFNFTGQGGDTCVDSAANRGSKS
jgi:hypothetical protein